MHADRSAGGAGLPPPVAGMASCGPVPRWRTRLGDRGEPSARVFAVCGESPAPGGRGGGTTAPRPPVVAAMIRGVMRARCWPRLPSPRSTVTTAWPMEVAERRPGPDARAGPARPPLQPDPGFSVRTATSPIHSCPPDLLAVISGPVGRLVQHPVQRVVLGPCCQGRDGAFGDPVLPSRCDVLLSGHPELQRRGRVITLFPSGSYGICTAGCPRCGIPRHIPRGRRWSVGQRDHLPLRLASTTATSPTVPGAGHVVGQRLCSGTAGRSPG